MAWAFKQTNKGNLMQKLSWILQVLLVFTFPVYAEDEMDMIIESAKELKGIGATKIIWKKKASK